jgi:hypothetical protein
MKVYHVSICIIVMKPYTFLMHLSNTVASHKEETASGFTGSKEQLNSCLL